MAKPKAHKQLLQQYFNLLSVSQDIWFGVEDIVKAN